MGKAFLYGSGGGAGLNFNIVNGLTAPSPKTNTIWLVTNEKVTGYYFTAKQPENMQPGEVWFSVGTSSEVAFNALKKNTVMVYPLNVKQMVAGALVAVTAKSWQNGEWVDWVFELYLYNDGHDNTDITGGWDSSAGTLTVGDSEIYLNANGLTTGNTCAETLNKINLGNYSKLSIVASDVDSSHGNDDGRHFVYVAAENKYTPVATQQIFNANTIYTLDISEFADMPVYIGIGTRNANLKISKIWLRA